MKSRLFEITHNPETGCITSVVLAGDSYKMNWVCCDDGYEWGGIDTSTRTHSEFHRKNDSEPVLFSFSEDDNFAEAVYENKRLRITVSRRFTGAGNLRERAAIKNIAHMPYTVCRDNFSLAFPFNDRYTYADDCMTNRCNTHIRCGGNVSYVNALRMGASELNLGMVLTEGAFVSYSQYGCRSNVRGCFGFEPESRILKSGEEYVLEWELFPHAGKSDFFARLAGYDSYIGIEAEHYTVFEGEAIRFKVTPHNGGEARVFLDGEELAVSDDGCVEYKPLRRGYHRFDIACGEISTFAEFNVKPPFAELVRRRLCFIAGRQQCLDPDSPLYGAYLVYDNETESQYFDFFNTDHNACRERLNMALTMIRYLQLREDEYLRASLDLFVKFLFREFYEESTGEVFNNIGKSRDALRLYNAPGVMLVFAELYRLTREERYLDNILRLAEKYYSIGGEKCYSNAVAVRKVMYAFSLAGEEREDDARRMLDFFGLHVGNMLKNGTSYPKHEVNYEQTIVTPAVTCISELGVFRRGAEREEYLRNAQMHLECLDRFSGCQPSCYLNEIAIRYWDDFWFGGERCFGDTLPHHLSCLSARAFAAFSELSGDASYLRRAGENIRNCLCLVDDDGHGYAAHVYPHTVNGIKGDFFDSWANDQDLPLYDAMHLCDRLPEFSV